MVGIIIAVILFNLIAIKVKKRLTRSEMLQIWLFTTLFQLMFDVFISLKYQGYWYFTKGVDWQSLLVYVCLVPPVNLIFLNVYPLKSPLWKQFSFFLAWNVGIVIYEVLTLLPEPWGYFHYGWWSLYHSIMINPFLLLILLGFYKLVRRLEHKAVVKQV
ncbi:hypothetical protein COJ96_13000 [Bacillus sp. AFS073361]|uniref:hypothetical protein n=1 Tax=Bacillaceae TaxID=186817 RepID=UPI000BF60B54|nr:hypothetical protein [Bacillus sp. AFS073361]PFP28610.1 hypothetical protein COJ96_13000 [Bacillus sp. AFS073361]